MNSVSTMQFENLKAAFAKLKYDPNYQAPKNTVLVVSLSAPPTIQNGIWQEVNAENRVRIDRAVLIGRQIAGNIYRDGGYETEVAGGRSAADFLPTLVVNAEAQQFYSLTEYAKIQYMRKHVVGISCGNRGEANMRTQMRAMTVYEQCHGVIYTSQHHVVFVTSLHQVPLAQYTASMIIPRNCNFTFEVVAASDEADEKLLAAEFGKIITYAMLGHLELPE
ncbi:MAG: hypothetical protein WCT08_04075 [Patescibacteria group bacterium]